MVLKWISSEFECKPLDVLSFVAFMLLGDVQKFIDRYIKAVTIVHKIYDASVTTPYKINWVFFKGAQRSEDDDDDENETDEDNESSCPQYFGCLAVRYSLDHFRFELTFTGVLRQTSR